MANTISGKILVIGQIENIPYQDKVFSKRELVLDATRFDPMTGEPFENYPKVEFSGKHVNDLDAFQVGQLVTVSFVLSGRKSVKDGVTNYFTNVQGYKVEAFQNNHFQPQQSYQRQAQGGQTQQMAAPMQSTSPVPPQPQTVMQAAQQRKQNTTQEDDNLPF